MDFGARFYDPLVGRFTSPDPIKDVSSANAVNPYVYCANNPLRYTDKFGLDKERPAPSPGYEGGDGGGGGGGRLTEPGNSGNPQAAGPLNVLQWLGNKVSSLNIACVAAQAQAMDFMLYGAVGDTGNTLFVTSNALIYGDTDENGNTREGIGETGYNKWKAEVSQDVAAGGGTAEFAEFTPDHCITSLEGSDMYWKGVGNFVTAVENTNTIKSGGQFDRIVVFAHGGVDAEGFARVGDMGLRDLFGTLKSGGFLTDTATIHMVGCKVTGRHMREGARDYGSLRWNAFAHPGGGTCTNTSVVKSFIFSKKGSYSYFLKYEQRNRYENL